MVATQIDVTERKRAEEALRESEAKIRRLVDSNIIGIFVWDFDGRILEANDEFLRMVSYDREDLVAGHVRWADLTPLDWRDRNNARIEQQKSSGRFQPFEKEFTRKDGSRVPILIGGATFEEGGNQGVAFVLDLTERKCVEDALREREVQLADARRELRQMIDTIPIPVASYSADARRDFVNAAWKQYTGLSDEAALGTKWSVVAHPDDIAGGERSGVTPLPPASRGIPRSASGVPTDSTAGSASIVSLRATRTARSLSGTGQPTTLRIASAPRMRCGRANTNSVRSSKRYQASSGQRTLKAK